MRRWHQVPSPKTVLSIAPRSASEETQAPGFLIGTNEGVWTVSLSSDTESTSVNTSIVTEGLRPAMVSAVASAGRRILIGASDGIAFTDDDGASWTASLLPGKLQVSHLIPSPGYESDRMIFAATLQGGVLRSTDGGAVWGFANLGLSDPEAVALSLSPRFVFDHSLVVAVNTGAFVSRNLGRTWSPLPIEAVAMPVFGLAWSQAALLAGSETRGIYHSTDGGRSFVKRATFRSGAVSAMAVSPDGSRVAAATPQVLAWSDDGGVMWRRPEGRGPRGVLCVAISDDGRLLCGTQSDGLWVY